MFGTPEDHNLRVYASPRIGSPPDDRDDIGSEHDRIRRRVRVDGPGPGWRRTCRASTRPTRPTRTAATMRRGCVPANCKRCSTTAVSQASAFRVNTAGWGCLSSTSGRSTPNRVATKCPSSSTFRPSRSVPPRSSTPEAKSRSANTSPPRFAATGTRPAAVGAQRWIRSGRCHHARRPAGRQMGHQRCQDVEHQRFRRRLRTDAGAHRLERAQARGLDDVPGADQQPRHHAAADQAGQRFGRVLRGVLRQPRTRRRRRRRRSQRRLARGIAAAVPRAARGRRRFGVRQRHRRRGRDRCAHRLGRAPRGDRPGRQRTSRASGRVERSCTGRCRRN